MPVQVLHRVLVLVLGRMGAQVDRLSPTFSAGREPFARNEQHRAEHEDFEGATVRNDEGRLSLHSHDQFDARAVTECAMRPVGRQPGCASNSTGVSPCSSANVLSLASHYVAAAAWQSSRSNRRIW